MAIMRENPRASAKTIAAEIVIAPRNIMDSWNASVRPEMTVES